MIEVVEKNIKGLRGEISIPPDKSISHRAVMFTSLCEGKSLISNFSKGKDCISTLNLFKNLGVDIKYLDETSLEINASGKNFLPQNNNIFDCGNSGTTMRLVSGILASQKFNSVLTGDESLSKRPMKRILTPLEQMGANIKLTNNCAPIYIEGQSLHGIDYTSPLSSAQIKSCVLLAGLNATGITKYTEPYKSRNHTEKMLEYLGANIRTENNTVIIQSSELQAKNIDIAGDISSAAFFIVAALITPNSDILIKNVGLNNTRTGIVDIVKKMGGDIETLNIRTASNEEIGDIRVRYTENLKACEIFGKDIPRLIDELPVIVILATQCEGKTVIKNAEDLRNKEADRISCLVRELKKIGANVEATDDGFIIEGKTYLKGDAELETYHDHRLAMSFYVAGLICKKAIAINGFEWTQISFPEFKELVYKLN